MKKTITFITVFLCCFCLITPLFASGLSASPPSFKINLSPAQSFTGNVNIINVGANQMDVNITPKREQTDGRTELYSDNGIAQWISVNPTNFILNPGESKTVQFTIKAPDTIDYNDARGVLMIMGTPITETTNSSNITSYYTKQGIILAVPLIVGLPGQIIESISLNSSNVPWALFSLMTGNLEYNVKNNGTVQLQMTNNVTVTGLFENKTLQSNGTAFPRDSYTLKTQWTPGFFDMGLYNVESNIYYGREQQTQNLQTRSTIFVFPTWLIIVIIILLVGWQIRKRDIKSPIKIKIEKNKK